MWGPNAAGKTSLLEAIVLLAWGRSHRTTADAEIIRWGTDLARIEGLVQPTPATLPATGDRTRSRWPSAGPASPAAASGSG